ncbi:MAG: MATE family efflux transporter [Lewinellaceae bacterium]|nr:MATE family efflux transporter [Lewinellaceae bacterium]
MNHSQELGTRPMGQLLAKMAIPASVGILVMSIYMIVDTIFVGRFVGTLGIAAITVVMPISFFISSIGMAIGVGGSSIISRALGADDNRKACHSFGNMASLTLLIVLAVLLAGSFFKEPLLVLFGANGDILAPAKVYFDIILIGVPGLAWAMMSNNVMRAEGRPKMAMLTMMVPAAANLVLDPILIIWLDMGLAGAAWATTISYYLSAGFALWFFFSGRSELRLYRSSMILEAPLVREIFSIGFVTLARQGTISLLTIVLNHSLFQYGSELAVAIYGVINRVMMFANFPVLGITQGFLPIAGYNYGARKWGRVRDIINYSIRSGTLIAVGLFTGILLFSEQIVRLFTNDPELLAQGPSALILTFLATPLITVQLIGAAYFQAIGKARPALFLTLTKQGFFLIPFVLLLPRFFGLDGIWYAFPVSDVLAAAVTYAYLRMEMRKRLDKAVLQEERELAAIVREE